MKATIDQPQELSIGRIARNSFVILGILIAYGIAGHNDMQDEQRMAEFAQEAQQQALHEAKIKIKADEIAEQMILAGE